MAWQMIPTDSSPNCRKNALLTIAGERTTLAFFFRFNPIGEYWTMDVARAETAMRFCVEKNCNFEPAAVY